MALLIWHIVQDAHLTLRQKNAWKHFAVINMQEVWAVEVLSNILKWAIHS